MHHAWKLTSEAARIASIVYAIDCLDIILTEMGIRLAITYNFTDMDTRYSGSDEFITY